MTTPNTTPATPAPATEEKPKRTRKPTPSLAGLLGDAPLKAEPVSPGTPWKRETTRSSAPRDKEQKRLDADGHRTYEQWVKVGKPEDPDKCPSVRYRVNPDALDALIAYARRVVGPGGPIEGKQMRYVREGVDGEGKAVTRFIYKDMPANTGK